MVFFIDDGIKDVLPLLSKCRIQYLLKSYSLITYTDRKGTWQQQDVICRESASQWDCVSRYPERAPLAELKHPEDTVLKLHCAIELGQVVVIDTQQLKDEDTEAKKK